MRKHMREIDPLICRLIFDHEIAVQEQALNLLRNLVCGKETDIELVFREMGEEKLMSILDSKLKSDQTVILTQVSMHVCI